MIKVLGLGDNVCDVYLHTKIMYPGGQALNFAVYSAQLGVQADFLGVFGQDDIARHVQQTLDKKGIGRSHCRSYPGENGFAQVIVENGERTFVGSNRGGVLHEHPIKLQHEDVSYASSFQLIHTSNNGFTDDILPTLYGLPLFVSYDFSSRWNEAKRVDQVSPYVDFAFLSCSELNNEETKALCSYLCQKGCGVVTATRGDKGAIAYDGMRFYHQLPYLVKTVDTMGAGDSFAAAMLITILKAMEPDGFKKWSDSSFRAAVLPDALNRAAEFSAQICLIHGAFGSGTSVPASVQARVFRELW